MNVSDQLKQMRTGQEAAFANLESVLLTDALTRRASRLPDYQGEAEALLTLARELAASPRTILQRLCEIALSLSHAQSAGISILEVEGEDILFRWHALAGEMAPYLWGMTPRDFAPCGVTLDRNAPQLFLHPERYYPYVQAIEPPIFELLLLPFHLENEPVGTLWVVSSQEGRAFDQEDVRLLTSLTAFAAAARKALLAQAASEQMNVSLIQADVQRAQQARLFDTALASIEDFVYTFDLEGRFTYVNQALLSLWKLELKDALGRNFFDLHYPDALAARLQGQIQTVIATGQACRDETPFSNVLEAGYYEYIFVPVFGIDGQVEAVAGSTRDITARHQEQEEKQAYWTERKRAEEEIRTLNARLQRAMTETHHRVKNNLQIISSLVEIQAGEDVETVPVTAMRRIGQHTRALAALHDLLTQEAKVGSATDTISAGGIMEKMLPLLRATTGHRQILFQGDDFRVTVGQGASLSLLISELISNAVKHGKGNIELTLTVQDRKALLEVCDDGPGFPPDFNWQTAANTGLSLIDSTGRYDLRGTISYENRTSGGARVRVIFPLPNVSEPA